MNCRINTGRGWTSRILMEVVTNPVPSWFVTLTMDDTHITRTAKGVPTLHRSRFQAWLGRKNRSFGPFRYFAVGEYGNESLRPHYHLSLFPTHPDQVRYLTDAWSSGFTSVYPMVEARARYLARYTTKKLTSDTDERLEEGQEPEFRSSSRTPGLGAGFVPVVVSSYRQTAGQKIIEERGDIERTVRFGQTVYPIPRYILTKCREELGIPTKHSERLKHPGYGYYHQINEADQCKETYLVQENLRHAEAKQKETRGRTQNI